jgi:phospholipid-transporting ATPase
MSSDFERLVGSSNPAYQARQRVGGYPPRPPQRSLDNSNPFLIDDGEDYDDTPVTDSRFHQPDAGGGSTYPYSSGRQPPAGYGAPGAPRDLLSDDPLDSSQMLARATSTGSKRSQNTAYGTGQPQGWIFDQDDPYTDANGSSTVHAPGGVPFTGSKMFNGVGSSSTDELRGAQVSKKRNGGGGLGGIWRQLGQGKFPWQKDKVPTGERIVFLNDSKGNGEQGFANNYVSTTKFNLVTFVPKFLVGESRSYGCGVS